MTKYEIYQENFEFRFGTTKDSIPSLTGNDIIELYNNETWHDPERLERFDDIDDARKCFEENYKSMAYTSPSASSPFWLLTGSIFWLEENEYTDDDEFDCGGNMIDFSAESYTAENAEG